MTAFDLPTVASPSTQKPDARTVNDGGTDVMRQVVVLGDPTSPASLATVNSNGSINVKISNATNSAGVPFFTSAREKFRDAFLTYDTTNNWTTVQTGSGMTISTGGVANGSRYLNIASGTTINAETIITSKTLFKAPCAIIVGLSMSQRIANCDAFLELVEVDPATGLVITDTTQPSARFNNARNGASFQFTGTNATTQTINVRQDGVTEITGTGTYATTAATGTTPNFLPAGLFEIILRNRDVQFMSAAVDSNATKTAPVARTQRVPNPDATYALRIRVKNAGTAPASSTDVRIHAVTITDDTRISVDFAHIAGTPSISNAMPVNIVNPSTLTVSQTGTWYSVSANGFNADSSTALGAGATFTGTTRDNGLQAYLKEFVANVITDQAGTLKIQKSTDNTNWFDAAVVAVTAGTPVTLQTVVTTRYSRVVYVNGGVAQGSMNLTSASYRS